LWPAFFRTDAGNEPVKVWIVGLVDADRRIVGRDIARVEFGWPIGMPVCDSVGGGIWEVRSTIKSGKVEARTYFGVDGDDMILLHGHEGKTDQDHEISVARKRWSEHQRRKQSQARITKSRR